VFPGGAWEQGRNVTDGSSILVAVVQRILISAGARVMTASIGCNRFGIGVSAILLIAFLIVGSSAEEVEQLSESGRKDRLRKIRSKVETFQVTAITGEEEQPTRLLAEPSLLYADNARELSDSSLWFWELAGRPVGATAIELNRAQPQSELWTFEFAALSPQKLRISLGDQPWITNPSGVTLRPIPVATVAETRIQRGQQMKRLAERFAAVEVHRSQGRIELRRLPTPVYRQTEAASGDGAIFVFAHGTNPEVLLSIGTLATDKTVWGYTLGAMAAEELVVTFDDKEVWREGLFTKPGARPTYLNGRVPETVK
jgi:hypothetical protein